MSTLQAEPRGSTHQDERAAQQEDSGQDGRSEERFNAVAFTAAADGRQRAQHCEGDPQPSRCRCWQLSLCSRTFQASLEDHRLREDSCAVIVVRQDHLRMQSTVSTAGA